MTARGGAEDGRITPVFRPVSFFRPFPVLRPVSAEQRHVIGDVRHGPRGVQVQLVPEGNLREQVLHLHPTVPQRAHAVELSL
ncbi:hypothetical protein [Streptomyces canarius]